MKKFFSLISLMFVFMVSLFFTACGEKKVSSVDLNNDGVIESWEEIFPKSGDSSREVNADIVVSNVEEFNSINKKVQELQTRKPVALDGQVDKDGNPIFDPATLPIEKPVVKLSQDIDFGGVEIEQQNLSGASFYGNNKVLKNFKFKPLEERDNVGFSVSYNLFTNVESVYDLNVFMGYQTYELKQFVGGEDYKDANIALFRNAYNLENITVKGYVKISCDSNVCFSGSMLAYNNKYFDINKDVEIEENDENNEENIKLQPEGLFIKNCKIVGKFDYTDIAEQDTMLEVNIAPLSVINMVSPYFTMKEKNNIKTSIVDNTVDATISFNKEKPSTKTGNYNDVYNYEFMDTSDILGFENINISGIVSVERDNGSMNIENCSSNIFLNINNCYTHTAVGGIAAVSYADATIKNCKSNLDLKFAKNSYTPETGEFSPTMFFGGIVGNSNSQIFNCQSTFNFDMRETTASINVGGIAGRLITNGEITNCEAVSNFNCNNTDTGYIFAGGVVGVLNNSLLYNNNVTGNINITKFRRAVVGGFVGASVDSTAIRNISHTSVTMTDTTDAFVSSFLGIAYAGNYESCLSTGNVVAKGFIQETATEVTVDAFNQKLETPYTERKINGFTNISVGLFYNYPFRNPERYNFNQTGLLEGLEEEHISLQNAAKDKHKNDYAKNYIDNGLKIDRYKQDFNFAIDNIYQDYFPEDSGYFGCESLNNMTAVPSIKNCLILSKHNVEYRNSASSNGQLYDAKDVFKYIALNGLWASKNKIDGSYEYNTTIYLNNAQVFDLESNVSTATSLLKVNGYGDGTILDLIGATQIKQMTNITKDNVYGCLRVYNNELFMPEEDVRVAVKSAKLLLGDAVSYYDREYALSGGDEFDLVVEGEIQINEDEEENLYFTNEKLSKELNTLVAYSINQMSQSSERVYTMNFKVNCTDIDLEDSSETNSLTREQDWIRLNEFERMLIKMLDRKVYDIVFSDETHILNADYSEPRYITIRYKSTRNNVEYIDAIKFQRIDIENFKVFEDDETNAEGFTYYSLKLIGYFSTSKLDK